MTARRGNCAVRQNVLAGAADYGSCPRAGAPLFPLCLSVFGTGECSASMIAPGEWSRKVLVVGGELNERHRGEKRKGDLKQVPGGAYSRVSNIGGAARAAQISPPRIGGREATGRLPALMLRHRRCGRHLHWIDELAHHNSVFYPFILRSACIDGAAPDVRLSA